MITVTANLANLEKRFSPVRIKAVQTRYAMQVGSDSNKFCKVDTGQTQATMKTSSNFEAGEVRWTTPYAKDAYYDPRVRVQKNPNAASRWFEVAKSQRFNQWMKLVERYLDGGR